jgi:hypothetical protein
MEMLQRAVSWARGLPLLQQAYLIAAISLSAQYILSALAYHHVLPVLWGIDWSGVTKNSTYLINGIVAITATYFYEGGDGLKRIFRPFLKVGFNPFYWFFAALILIPILYLTLLLDDLLYFRGLNFHPMTLPSWETITHYSPQFLRVAVSDELFWIGFIYPRMVQSGYSSLRASLVIGLLWGAVYVPFFFTQFFVASGLNMPNILLGWFSLTPLYIWLYYRTGSALVVLLFNLFMQFLFTAIPVLPHATGDNQATAMANLVCLVFGLLLWKYFPHTRLPSPQPIKIVDSRYNGVKVVGASS